MPDCVSLIAGWLPDGDTDRAVITVHAITAR